MADRPHVPQDVRLLDPPDGVDEDAYWDNVRLHASGLPWFVSCRLARAESVGARERGGPLRKTRAKES